MRINDLSWGASSSLKKRSLPPTSPSTPAKRPKQIPFIVESSSEDGSGSDDDDGYNLDRHIALAPEQPARTDIGKNHALYGLGKDTQRQGTNRAFEGRSSSETLAPQPGRDLNRDRLKMLMAKKQGGLATPSSMSESRLLKKSAKIDLRNRPQNATQAGSLQSDVYSPAPRSNPTISQGGTSRHSVQGKAPSQSEESLQGQRRRPQDPESSHIRARIQRSPVPASELTTARKAGTARPQSAANTNSLRNLLDMAKTAQRDALQEPDIDNTGSKWRRAQAERAPSAKPFKDSHRLGVSARFSHTLTTGKVNKDRSPRRAPATTGFNAINRPLSEHHTTPPAVAPGLAGRQMQPSGSNSPSTPKITPSVKRTPAVDLQQSDHNARLGTTKPPVKRDPFLVTSSDRAVLAQSAPVERTMNTAHNGVADGAMCQTPSLSSTRSNTSHQCDEVAIQETVEKSVSSQEGLMRSSTTPDKYGITYVKTQQADRSHHPKKHVQKTVNSSRAFPTRQVVTKGSELTSNTSDVLGRATSVDDLDAQKSSMTGSAALFRLAAGFTDVDTHRQASSAIGATNTLVDKVVAHASEVYPSPVAPAKSGVQPRMPVAVMVRPGTPGGQSPIRRGSGKDVFPTPPMFGAHTSRIINAPGTTKCLQPSSNEQVAEKEKDKATNAPLALDSAQRSPVSKAPEPMDLSSDRPDDSMLEQGAQSPVETAVDDAISEHASVGPTKVVEAVPSKSVDNSHNRPAARTSCTLEVLQPVSTTTSESKGPLLDTDTACALPQPPATIDPLSITTDTSLSQPVAVLTDSDDAEKVAAEHVLPTAAAQNSTSRSAAELTLPSPTISPTAEPYFEYSIHQAITSSPSSTTIAELSAQPFTTLDSANAQTKKLFRSAKQQYELLSMQCKLTTSKVLKTGLSVHEASFISLDDPSKTLTLKLWVKRAEVNVYANRTPSPTSSSLLISKTLYALRLWRLMNRPSDSDSDSDSGTDTEDEDEDGEGASREKEQIRVYHPLPHICNEIHTSLESANRAAKRVQIELSHEKVPKSMQAKWQTDNLRDLNGKLEDLRREAEEKDEGEGGGPSLFEYEEGRRRGCWKSTFKGVGLGGSDFELLVTSVGVSGPRNL